MNPVLTLYYQQGYLSMYSFRRIHIATEKQHHLIQSGVAFIPLVFT